MLTEIKLAKNKLLVPAFDLFSPLRVIRMQKNRCDAGRTHTKWIFIIRRGKKVYRNHDSRSPAVSLITKHWSWFWFGHCTAKHLLMTSKTCGFRVCVSFIPAHIIPARAIDFHRFVIINYDNFGIVSKSCSGERIWIYGELNSIEIGLKSHWE